MDSTTRHDARPALLARAARHEIHGLVAIANGPDYCLCGENWPCRPTAESAH